MFTAKFYTAGRKDCLIVEASGVAVHEDDAGHEIVLTTAAGTAAHMRVGPASDYRFAIIENAAGKTTEIIGDRR
jgi:hypothetical protein